MGECAKRLPAANHTTTLPPLAGLLEAHPALQAPKCCGVSHHIHISHAMGYVTVKSLGQPANRNNQQPTKMTPAAQSVIPYCILLLTASVHVRVKSVLSVRT